MLTDSEYAKPHKSRTRAVKAETNRRWSDKQKIECVTTFIALGGSVGMTSAALKIPEQTIFVWKRSQWWHEMVSEIKQQGRMEVSAKLRKLLEKSLVVVEDRMENGDFVWDQKNSQLARKPVSMKDAHKVASDSILLSEKLERSESFTVDSNQIEDKLAKLAKAFQDLAKGVVNKEALLAEDIEYVEQVGSETDEGSFDAMDEGSEREES